jgi:hypothetical protein
MSLRRPAVYRTYRHRPLRIAVRTAVLALALAAGTITLGVAAWADEPVQGGDAQSQQPTPTTKPTPTTQPTPTTKPTPTSTPAPPTPVRPIRVTVSPPAGSAGTTVQLTAQVGQCHQVYAYFYDSKSDGVTIAGGAKPIKPLRVSAGTLTASYTLTRKDATGPARFTAVCGLTDGTARAGEASFQVRVPRPGPGPSPSPSPGPGPGGGDGPLQVPSRVDTGLGGTADRGIDPVWLLLPAGLLLIAMAVALRLRQVTARRRR